MRTPRNAAMLKHIIHSRSRTTLLLRLSTLLVVCLHAVQEILSALGMVYVVYAHMDTLGNDAVADALVDLCAVDVCMNSENLEQE